METQAAVKTGLHHWALPEPIVLRAAEHGVNNDNRIIQTPDGAYVLRIYRHTTADAVRYEHALLAALEQVPLPFSIPTPVPTRNGETVVPLGQRDGEARLLSLARFFPGAPPTAGNLAQAKAGGTALGHLDQALAALPHLPDPPHRGRFVDLDRVHPAVPDAVAAVRAVPTAVLAEPDRLLALLERVQPAMLGCYEVLPTQVIHGDYDGEHGNVLLDGARVSAVLDFELAGPDLRALDVAIPLVYWPMPADEPGRWATYEAFVRGYASVTPLSGAELNALPVISLGAVFAFLIASIGECLAAADRWDRVVPLLGRRALTHGVWLAENEERFIERLHTWVDR